MWVVRPAMHDADTAVKPHGPHPHAGIKLYHRTKWRGGKLRYAMLDGKPP
jgi:hypothetical protein